MFSNTNNLLTTGNQPLPFIHRSRCYYTEMTKSCTLFRCSNVIAKACRTKVAKINSIARSTEQKRGIVLSKCLFPFCNIFSSGVNFVAWERAGKRDY